MVKVCLEPRGKVPTPKTKKMAINQQANEYYAPCLRDYRSIDNSAAQAEWFESTEPREGLPTHSKVLHVLVAETIMQTFCTRLQEDIMKNAAIAWIKGTPLPGKKDYVQPLAEGTES